MGGSSLAPEVICATAGVELTVLDSSDPDMVRAALADRLDRTVVVVSSKSGSHRRDRQPAPRLRGGVHRGRHRPGRPHRRRHRPGQPAGPGGPRRRLPRRQRRPRRRRPLLRADRVRARPERAGRRRHRRPCSTRPSRSPTCSPTDDEANPGAAPRRRASAGTVAAARQARRSSTAARASSGSPTGPSSSSPSAPASRARAPARRRRATPTTPRCAGPRPTSPSSGSSATPRTRRPRPRTPDGEPPRSEVHVSGAARRPDAALGGRRRRRRPAARHQPVRPARRRERQEGRPRPARRRRQRQAPAAFTDGAIEVRALGGDCSARPAPSPTALRRPARPARPAPRLPRRDGLPRPARRRPAGRRPGAPLARRTGRPDDVRLGAALPALHRAVPQGRPGDRGLPADHRAPRTQDLRRPRAATFTFGDFIAAQAAGDAQVLADHGRPVLRLHLTDHDTGLAQLAAVLRLPTSSTRKETHEPGSRRRTAPTRCATRATSGCPGSPAPAAW